MTLPFAIPAAIGLAGGLVETVASALTGNEDKKNRPAGTSFEDKLAALDAKTRAKIEATGQEFETMFLENMLGQLFQSSGEEGPLGNNGTGGDTYRSMLVNEYARTLAKSGGVGISHSVMNEMIRLQERSGGNA